MTDQGYDDEIEKTLLALIATCEEARGLLEKLGPQDFGGAENQLFLAELKLMVDAGYPLGDPLAIARWFHAASTKRRWADRYGDAYYPPAVAAEVGDTCPTFGNVGFYLERVFEDWAVRGLRYLAENLLADLARNSDDPVGVILRFQQLWDRFLKKADARLPKLLEVDA